MGVLSWGNLISEKRGDPGNSSLRLCVCMRKRERERQRESKRERAWGLEINRPAQQRKINWTERKEEEGEGGGAPTSARSVQSEDTGRSGA